MARKRTQAAAGIVAEGGPRKKRKAAEEATAKTKQIADDESDFDQDDFESDLLPVTKVKRVKKPKEIKPEDMPLVAQGFHYFEGFSDTVRNTEIAALTKAKPDIEQSRKYGFTLKPVILTEGPLAGKTMLMLEPTATFRFLDLPPEIRNIIYGHAIQTKSEIEIHSHKPTGKERRSVVINTVRGRYGYGRRRRGTRNQRNSNTLTPKAAMHSLLRVSKQVQAETGAMIYGDTKFSFRTWSDFTFWLDTIGSMRRFVCEIELPYLGRGFSKARPTLKKLQDSKDLRSITVGHDDICGNSGYNRSFLGIQGCVNLVSPLLEALVKDGDASVDDLLDIVTVKSRVESGGKCRHCDPKGGNVCYLCLGRTITHDKETCQYAYGCKVKCNEHEAHCEDLEEDIRDGLAEALGIEIEE